MDPVSIGIAVAALLGTKAAEGFATQAGTRTWDAMQRLATSVRARLSPRGVEALDRLATAKDSSEAQSVVASEVQASVSADETFRNTLEGLLKEVSQNGKLAGVVAVARDNARQVNFGGNNSGPINLG
ncbi:hypothetical protein [Catellatospora paridis]|uniref:hypothetical protein n=1 Tax=Catellatospora paridis TaxID=1617086 RepID=UPI0012D4854E|nr:hypothetical protein [Catellatospora paridis]